jgi:aminomethyltransferase
MPQRTPLYDWHVAHGGRMVDFAGWEMPVQYTSIIEEHQATRTACGLFDISHMGRLSFAGGDALALIQRVFTNNAATMKDGQVRYGLICNEQGGIRDDVLVYRWPYGWALVVNAGNRTKIVDWLAAHKERLDVQVSDQTADTCMIAVQGPRALTLCQGLTEVDAASLAYYYAAPTHYHDKPAVVSRTGYTGEDGVELMVGKAQAIELWEELVARGARPCGLGARDTLRLEAAMPLYGHELTEEIDPLQAGLAWAVKLDKGDFIGRAALLRRKEDAALPQRVGLELEGKRPAREGCDVRQGSTAVGRVTSGTLTPTLNKAIAMAYVARACVAPGTQLSVAIRGKLEPARVVPLPFYKRPKT